MPVRKSIFISVILSVLIFTGAFSFYGHADGMRESAPASVSEENKRTIEFGKCKAGALFECSTGTLLAGYNENEPLPAGHLAKLMEFLLAAEMISEGKLSEEDTSVCSRYANSQQGSQIWLDEGEKISVKELMRSISIGNANDACVCLAEKIAASESGYIELANCKAKRLEMLNSHFCDCTGMSADTVFSAKDVCVLCSELVKLESFSDCFTTWMDTVRGGKAELVSQNRLIRFYKGIKGFKVCRTENVGACGAVCAKRGDMTVCAVILGAVDEDELLIQLRKLLDSAFASFEVYDPEVPEEAADSVMTERGVKAECLTEIPGLSPAIIPKGSYRSVTVSFERIDKLTAPVDIGTVVGHIEFALGDSILLSSDICSAEKIDEVDLVFSLKRVLLNLLNL